MKLTILKQTSFCHARDLDNKTLRRQVKEKYSVGVRRLDNFTLCGLAAVAELGETLKDFEQISLFSCAQYFSIELVQQMLIDIQNGNALRPLDFVSTVGNAANFYIAKEFSINGSNLFIGADTQAFEKVTLLSALEANDESSGAVVIAIWRETQNERCCHAFLVRGVNASDMTYPIYQGLDKVNDISTLSTPCVIQFPTSLANS
jgi:hypothetical protein